MYYLVALAQYNARNRRTFWKNNEIFGDVKAYFFEKLSDC